MMSGAKKRVPQRRFKEFLNAGAWEQCKLDELTISIGDGLHGTPKYDENGSYYFINGNNLVDSKVSVTAETKKVAFEALSNDDRRLDSTSILMSINGTIGILARYNNENIMLGKSVAYITPKNINRDFLFYQLQGNVIQSYFYKNLTGTTIKNLGLGTIKNAIVMSTLSEEESKIGQFFYKLDQFITLHQRKLDKLQVTKKALLQEMFPEEGQDKPKRRFKGFTDAWEQRKLGDLYKRVNERNDGTLGRDKWISVAKMYFQDPDKVQSNNLDTRTYVMKKGDIAFEGHPNNEFKFGRFVLNDIGTGIISELFPIYRPITEYDLDFWKYAIQLERVMAPIFAKSITSSGNSSNKLDHNHFLNQELLVPNIEEQKKIGTLLSILSKNITLHQRKLDKLKNLKQAYLNEMFV